MKSAASCLVSQENMEKGRGEWTDESVSPFDRHHQHQSQIPKYLWRRSTLSFGISQTPSSIFQTPRLCILSQGAFWLLFPPKPTIFCHFVTYRPRVTECWLFFFFEIHQAVDIPDGRRKFDLEIPFFSFSFLTLMSFHWIALFGRNQLIVKLFLIQ